MNPAANALGVAASRPAVFLDRDGTLNEMVYDAEHGRLDSPFTVDQLALRPGAAEFVGELTRRGWLTVIVTNQPGVAKGTLSLERLDRIHAALRARLAVGGGRIDDILYSPFHPDPGPFGRREFARSAPCRKPAPGMWYRAADRHSIDLAASVTVGDGFVDVEAGRRAGTRTVLLARAKPELFDWFAMHPEHRPDHLATDFAEVLAFVGQPTRSGADDAASTSGGSDA